MGGGFVRNSVGLGWAQSMLCTLETSKFNGPTCHVSFLKQNNEKTIHCKSITEGF